MGEMTFVVAGKFRVGRPYQETRYFDRGKRCQIELALSIEVSHGVPDLADVNGSREGCFSTSIP